MSHKSTFPPHSTQKLNTETIFGITLSASVVNRVFTNFIELANTRILKNVGLAHIQHHEKYQMAENLKKASPNARFGVEIFKVYKNTGF